jgi:hypothetical protein
MGTVKLAANSFPDELRNATILIMGDNQGAVSCVNNLRSPVLAINQELQRLFRVSCFLQCDVLATWVPHNLLGAADRTSYRENQMLPIGGSTPTCIIKYASGSKLDQMLTYLVWILIIQLAGYIRLGVV